MVRNRISGTERVLGGRNDDNPYDNGGASSDHVAIDIDNGGGNSGVVTQQGKASRWRRSARLDRNLRFGVGSLVCVLCAVLVFCVSAYYYPSGDTNFGKDDTGIDTSEGDFLTDDSCLKIRKFGHGPVLRGRDWRYCDKDDRRREENYNEDDVGVTSEDKPVAEDDVEVAYEDRIVEDDVDVAYEDNFVAEDDFEVASEEKYVAVDNDNSVAEDDVKVSSQNKTVAEDDLEEDSEDLWLQNYLKDSYWMGIGFYTEAGRDELKKYEVEYQASLVKGGQSLEKRDEHRQPFDTDHNGDDSIDSHDTQRDVYVDMGHDGNENEESHNEDGAEESHKEDTSVFLHSMIKHQKTEKVDGATSKRSRGKSSLVGMGGKSVKTSQSDTKKRVRSHRFSGISCEMKLLNSSQKSL